MKYAIIGAMEEEVAAIKERITVHSTVRVANCTFYEGEFNGQSIVVLQSGIGKVNAALSTTILHERFFPDYVINTGSAGGADPALSVGDIVIGEHILHHDADATAFGYSYGQIPQMPETFTSNQTLMEKALSAANHLNGNVNIVKGLIGTSDSFMSDENRVRIIQERFPTVKALEMEAAAIAQVCYQYETPFLIVRSLSDIAGKSSEVSFDQFLGKAAANSAELIMRTIEMD